MSLEVKNPDIIGWQIIDMMFPPDDQPNLAEKGVIVEEPIHLDKIKNG